MANRLRSYLSSAVGALMKFEIYCKNYKSILLTSGVLAVSVGVGRIILGQINNITKVLRTFAEVITTSKSLLEGVYALD